MRELLAIDVRFKVFGHKIGVRGGLSPDWVKRSKTKAVFRDPEFMRTWLRDRLAHSAAEFYLRDVLKRPRPTSCDGFKAEKLLYDNAVLSAQHHLESIYVVRVSQTADDWDKWYVVEQKFSLASKSKV